MPTTITSATHGDSLSGSPEKRVDVAPDGTMWALIIQSSKARFFSSSNGGSTWSLSTISDLSLGSGQDTAVPSFFIDADGYAHVSFCRWQANPQVVIYARGTPRTGGGWSWTQQVISPASGRTEVDSDVIAFRNGTGWSVFVTYGLNASGAKVAKLTVSSTGTITVDATLHGPSLGAGGGYQFGGSLEFDHIGDGKTPSATPHLYFVTAQQASAGDVRAHKATYSGGIWTWQTPIALATSVQVGQTSMCSVFDGTYDMVAWDTGSGGIEVREWTVASGTVTTRNPPALPGGTGNAKGLTLIHDPVTDNIYLLTYGTSNGDIISTKFNRTTLAWDAWVTIATRSVYSGDGDVNGVRHPPRDSADTLYSEGNGPYTIKSVQVAALIRSPLPPVLTSPPNGAVLDLEAVGGTFTWDYRPVSPGDTQQGYQMRRQYGATTEYWNAGSSAWTAAAFTLSQAAETWTGANGAAWPAQWGTFFGGATGNTFDIQGNKGRIITGAGIPNRAGLRLSNSVIDFEVVGTVSVTGTAEAQVWWRTDATVSAGYALVFSVAGGIRVQSIASGVVSTRYNAATVGGPAVTAATDYSFRIRHAGSSLTIKTWLTSGGEPGSPQLVVSDGLYSGPGYVGLAQWYPGQTALFDNFELFTDNPVFNASALSRAEFVPNKWTTGTTYSWGIRTRSSTGADSAWSASRTVIASVAPDLVVNEPSGLTFGESTPLVEWTYTSVTPQRDFQVRIVPTSGVVIDPNDPLPSVWSSGVVGSSIARSIRVGTPLTNDTSYRAYVKCTDANGVVSGWAYSDFTVSIAPPEGPVVEVIDDENSATGVLRIRMDISGESNFLSATQWIGAGGWDVDANCTLAAQSDDSANQLLASLLVTSVAAGTAGAVTAVGSPPEAPFGQAALTRPLSFPVVGGQPYTALASFKAAGTTRAARISIRWYDDDDGTGALISTTVSTQVNADNVAYTQASVTALAPLGAKLARLGVEILGAVAGGEVFYVSRISLHPGRSLAWQPGGYAGIQTLRVERSLDGGTTWQTFIERIKPDYYQRVTTYDRTALFGREVQYRGYTDVDPGSGAVLSSAASVISEITVDSDTWVIRDPGDIDGEFRAYVVGYDRNDAEVVSVSRAAGREYPIIDSEGPQSGEGTLSIYVPPAQREVAYDVLRRVVTMVVQSPDGLMFLARFPERDYQVTDTRARLIEVRYVEVESF